jgi:hypothetical protein
MGLSMPAYIRLHGRNKEARWDSDSAARYAGDTACLCRKTGERPTGPLDKLSSVQRELLAVLLLTDKHTLLILRTGNRQRNGARFLFLPLTWPDSGPGLAGASLSWRLILL